jgi:GxxExxY protein
MGLKADVEVPIDMVYEDLVLDNCYRMDILVENEVIVEIKSVSDLADIHTAQMLTYLKLAHKKLGLLLNFNVRSMTQGIKRIVYTHTPSNSKYN